jgi:hypothetical protein
MYADIIMLSFECAGPQLWNKWSQDVRDSPSFGKYKQLWRIFVFFFLFLFFCFW